MKTKAFLVLAVCLTCMTSARADIYSWGSNTYGQLGDGTTTDRTSPVAVVTTGTLAGKTVTAIAAGATSSLALTADGLVFSWGANIRGQLGDGTTTNSSTPVAVSTAGVLSGKTVVQIAAGWATCGAVTSDGLVFTWGAAGGGTLGNGVFAELDDYEPLPLAVDTSGVLAGKTVVSLSAGDGNFFATGDDGLLYAWGYNASGQLGIGSPSVIVFSPTAVDASGVLSGKAIIATSSGSTHAMALSSDGLIYGWGNVALGDGTSGTASSPVAVDMTGALAGKTVSAIASSGWGGAVARHYVVASDGTAYGWGANAEGFLGDGSTTDRFSPVAVASGYLATDIAAGLGEHALILGTPTTTTVTAASRYNYAANFGWLDWHWSATSSEAPVFESTILYGKVYSANVGWIDLGDGTPSGKAGQYGQTNGDIGVNHDGAGNLSGYAYGANIGWIIFDSSIATPPQIDLTTGALSGYAYAANCGWIQLAGIKTVLKPGADTEVIGGIARGDGIPDAWEAEMAQASGHPADLSLLGANDGSDFDHDGVSDLAEYLADTNPFTPNQPFAITQFQLDPSTGNIDIDWNGSHRRAYTVWYSGDLKSWTALAPQLGTGAGLTLENPNSEKLFFRIQASLPLAAP